MNVGLEQIATLVDSGAIFEGNLEYFLDLTLNCVSLSGYGLRSASIWLTDGEPDSFRCLRYVGELPMAYADNYGDAKETVFQSAIYKDQDIYGYLHCQYESAAARVAANIDILEAVCHEISNVYCSERYLKNDLFSGINYEQLINESPDAIMITTNGVIVECNQATVSMFKAANKRALFGVSVGSLSPKYQPNGSLSSVLALENVESALLGRNKIFGWMHKRLDNEEFSSQVSLSSIKVDEKHFIFAIVRDFSHEERVHNQLVNKVKFCQITGLYNQDALVEVAASLDNYHLILVNVESLSDVSHVLGMSAEKDYIRILSNRIKTVLARDNIFIGRGQGGEIFFVISGAEMANLENIVNDIEQCIDQGVTLVGVEIPTESYYGIVVYESLNTGDSPWQSVRSAVNSAKQDGTKIVWFDERIKQTGIVRSLLITDLKDAIKNEQLYLLFQPKLSLSTNKIESVEALIRWNHPEKGIIPPDLFIPLAEKTEFIHDITRWVIRSCCKQAISWKAAGLDLTIALNLSTKDLCDERLITYIQSSLKEFGLSAISLQCEVTESAAVQHEQVSLKTITELKAMGLEIAIDDYGTGYSSLSHLRTFPLSVLKIDRSFITDLCRCKMNQAVVKSTISMCHEIGVKVVAEGIEDEDSLHLLSSWGCDIGQGYFISRPISAEDVKSFIERVEK